MEEKTCTLCGETKLVTEFYKRKGYNYRSACKKCENKISRDYYSQNKDGYYEQRKEYLKQYRENNREKARQYNKEYRQKNLEKVKKQIYEIDKRRSREDKLYRLKRCVRSNIKNSFVRKKFSKKLNTQEILQCDINFFVNYLLQTFKNNYGCEWDKIEKVHIDHIIPLATAHTEEEVYRLCHYSNLQLLKEKDNLAKNSKLQYNIEEYKKEME